MRIPIMIEIPVLALLRVHAQIPVFRKQTQILRKKPVYTYECFEMFMMVMIDTTLLLVCVLALSFQLQSIAVTVLTTFKNNQVSFQKISSRMSFSLIANRAMKQTAQLIDTPSET